MKHKIAFAAALLLALAALLVPVAQAETTPEIDFSQLTTVEDNACVPVYCDGEFGGYSCGPTTADIIEGAILLCETVSQQ